MQEFPQEDLMYPFHTVPENKPSKNLREVLTGLSLF